MQSVHTPHLILGALAACAAALALFLTLGHHSARHTQNTHGLALIGGMPLQQARCQQWLDASASERARGIQALGAVVGGPTPFGQATALTSDQAERLFDRACSNSYARNFLLYELYTRAAGFRSVVDPHV